MTTDRIFNKNLIRVDLKFGDINWEKATIKQYELGKDDRVWRVFLNGYAKNGFVVFDEERMSKDEVIEKLSELKPEIKSIRRLTVSDLIDDSMSWNRTFGKGKV
jgi:hypothetical protein